MRVINKLRTVKERVHAKHCFPIMIDYIACTIVPSKVMFIAVEMNPIRIDLLLFENICLKV